MICEFQKQHELDYADRRKAMNEKNSRTALDNTADDIQEVRDDNGCDDVEEEDDNEDEEHGEGSGMLQQECKTRWSSTHAIRGMLKQECKTRSSPERLFFSVGLVKSDLRGRLLDTREQKRKKSTHVLQ
jgi:hypothetical protein